MTSFLDSEKDVMLFTELGINTEEEGSELGDFDDTDDNHLTYYRERLETVVTKAYLRSYHSGMRYADRVWEQAQKVIDLFLDFTKMVGLYRVYTTVNGFSRQALEAWLSLILRLQDLQTQALNELRRRVDSSQPLSLVLSLPRHIWGQAVDFYTSVRELTEIMMTFIINNSFLYPLLKERAQSMEDISSQDDMSDSDLPRRHSQSSFFPRGPEVSGFNKSDSLLGKARNRREQASKVTPDNGRKKSLNQNQDSSPSKREVRRGSMKQDQEIPASKRDGRRESLNQDLEVLLSKRDGRRESLKQDKENMWNKKDGRKGSLKQEQESPMKKEGRRESLKGGQENPLLANTPPQMPSPDTEGTPNLSRRKSATERVLGPILQIVSQGQKAYGYFNPLAISQPEEDD
nr:PREDICTED: uncharacterized protein LOC102355453 [Latimeria chalumnae]|eukprot:XP_014341394.1 PREDICTED: uncharacterized protein LOC102355453 [Latimeria chalumnae]